MRFVVSVLDYLGKFEDGVLVLLSISYENNSYDATYYYTKEHLLLTVPDELEELIGCSITEYPDYPDLIRFIMKKVIPYNEIINRLDLYEHK